MDLSPWLAPASFILSHHPSPAILRCSAGVCRRVLYKQTRTPETSNSRQSPPARLDKESSSTSDSESNLASGSSTPSDPVPQRGSCFDSGWQLAFLGPPLQSPSACFVEPMVFETGVVPNRTIETGLLVKRTLAGQMAVKCRELTPVRPEFNNAARLARLGLFLTGAQTGRFWSLPWWESGSKVRDLPWLVVHGVGWQSCLERGSPHMSPPLAGLAVSRRGVF